MSSTRRELLRRLLATGGVSGLAGASVVEAVSATGDVDGGAGVADQGSVAVANDEPGQHYWNQGLRDHTIPGGSTVNGKVSCRFHSLLFLDYRHEGPPTDRHRAWWRSRIDRLEEAFDWNHAGLMFTVGYSPTYFDRYDRPLEAVDLPPPRRLSRFDEPAFDTSDLCVHLASDSVATVLRAERMLFEERRLFGLLPYNRHLDLVDRRTGFIGEGLPHRHQDVDGIPDSRPVAEDAPEYMGFRSDTGTNQAGEDTVAIESGRFAGGTTQHVALLRLDLEDWYGSLDVQERVSRMYDAGLDVSNVGRHGEKATERGFTGTGSDRVREHARDRGQLGHAEKAARARPDGLEPLILRRDFDTVHGGHAALNFVSLQRAIGDHDLTWQLMTGMDLAEEFDGVDALEDNGIQAFFTVLRRGNYLVPPVERRAFPEP